MSETERNTLELIHKAAKAEFLEKGFRAASLRNIVKTAGYTLGAFYGYYDSKEELFDALVGEQAEYVFGLYDATLDDFGKLSGEEQTRKMNEVSGDTVSQMLDYIYDNYDEFKLIILRSEGTKYENFIHQLVEREEVSTYAYMETLEKTGHTPKPVSRKLVHMVASGMFTGIFETVVHDMPKEEAVEYVRQLRRFYTAGWEELLGVKFGE